MKNYRELLFEVGRRLGIKPRNERPLDSAELEVCDRCGGILDGVARCITCGTLHGPD